MVVAGAGGCGSAGSHAGRSAGSTHSASAWPSQRGASHATGTLVQPAGTSSGSGAPGTGATGGGQDETVGIWPVRTRAQAIHLQQAVDAGHQPWLLDPMQVAVAYVRSEWHVSQPYVRRIGVTRYLGRVAATAVTILTVAQPVRTGSSGIWVIASATQHRLSPGATAPASGTPSSSR
jgi:hypothetical protein